MTRGLIGAFYHHAQAYRGATWAVGCHCPKSHVLSLSPCSSRTPISRAEKLLCRPGVHSLVIRWQHHSHASTGAESHIPPQSLTEANAMTAPQVPTVSC